MDLIKNMAETVRIATTCRPVLWRHMPLSFLKYFWHFLPRVLSGHCLITVVVNGRKGSTTHYGCSECNWVALPNKEGGTLGG